MANASDADVGIRSRIFFERNSLGKRCQETRLQLLQQHTGSASDPQDSRPMESGKAANVAQGQDGKFGERSHEFIGYPLQSGDF
jgi:hypothetical protein